MSTAIRPFSPSMLAFEWTEGGALLEVTCSDHGRGPARHDPIALLWLCDRSPGCTAYVTVEHVERDPGSAWAPPAVTVVVQA